MSFGLHGVHEEDGLDGVSLIFEALLVAFRMLLAHTFVSTRFSFSGLLSDGFQH